MVGFFLYFEEEPEGEDHKSKAIDVKKKASRMGTITLPNMIKNKKKRKYSETKKGKSKKGKKNTKDNEAEKDDAEDDHPQTPRDKKQIIITLDSDNEPDETKIKKETKTADVKPI